MIATISLDLKGLKCPAPTLKAKRQLKLMADGEILHVVCSDPLSSLDIPFLAQELGHALVEQAENEGMFEFWIQVAFTGRNDGGVWPLEADG